MDANPFSQVIDINVTERDLGIKQVTVIIKHEGYDIKYVFIDNKNKDKSCMMIKWEAYKTGTTENISSTIRTFAPRIIFNFVEWLFKTYNDCIFKEFRFEEPDGYFIKYMYYNGQLKLLGHGESKNKGDK